MCHKNIPLNFDFVADAAKGRWTEILEGMGVPSEILNKRKHHPCPCCGGKDRFRFTDAHQSGWFICNQCGQGGGFKLLSLIYGYSYRESVMAVAEYLNLIDRQGYHTPAAQRRRIEPKPESPREDKQAELVSIWDSAKPVTADSPVALYLASRKINWSAIQGQIREIRYLERYPYWGADKEGKFHRVGYFPCMVAAIRGIDGELNGLHFTYLQSSEIGYRKLDLLNPYDGTPLPSKKIKSRYESAISGSACRLFASDSGVLCLAEGLETAMAAHLLHQQPVWACLTANGIKTFQIPQGIRKVVVFADNDANMTGENAAEAFKQRVSEINPDVEVKIYLPLTIGYDMLDVLIERSS